MTVARDEPWLSVREAARRVDRAEETVRRWIWAGKLPACKLDGAYRVREHDLDAVVRRVPAPRRPEERPLALGEWVAKVQAWHADHGVPSRGGAGQLVEEDRTLRSGDGGR